MQRSPDLNNLACGEVYIFGEFELNPDRCVLMKNGAELPLRRQCFQILKYLILHHGVVVSKQELTDAVWCDVVVTESSLTQCILTIRRVLDDESKTLIRSVPRYGYLFDHPLTVRNSSPPAAFLTSSPRTAMRRFLSWPAVAVFLLAFVVLAYAWSNNPHALPRAQPLVNTAPLPASIAVLPFEDLSANQDQAYISDGISEEVLNMLARDPNLVVIARASSFAFKGKNQDVKSIAARLNVANVLEGSVRKNGSGLRVMARLMNAYADGPVWSQSYDLEANDIHMLQSRITDSVISALNVEPQVNNLVVASKPEAEAFRHYLLGRNFHGRRAPGDLERAIRQFRSAVEIDAGFADAWVGLAGSIWLNALEQGSDLTDTRVELKYALDRALELEPNNPEANARTAFYYWDGAQNELAQKYFERALAFGQNDTMVLSAAAGFAYRDFKYQEAVEFQQRATMLDPLSFNNQANLGVYLRCAGRFDESISVYQIAFDLNPNADQTFWQDYFISYLLNGQFEQAEAIALRLPVGEVRDQSLAMVYLALDRPARNGEMIGRLAAESSIGSALRLAEYYAFSGDFDRSFQWLDQARLRQLSLGEDDTANPIFDGILQSPFLQKLTRDVRWKDWQKYVERQIQKPVVLTPARELAMTTD